MIKRYQTDEMSDVLSDLNKLRKMWQVERATIAAAEAIGQIPGGVTERIRAQLPSMEIIAARAGEIEQTTGHDVQSFIDAIREFLELELRRYVHEYTTSTDTTESAFNLLVVEAANVILTSMLDLIHVVGDKAFAYRDVPKAGRTHTQHGAPSTVGLYFLGWYDALMRRYDKLTASVEAIKVGKIRGLVGTYDRHVTPQLEELALRELGLQPVKTCYQIILRDRFADVINDMAVLAALLENMAVNIRLGAQTEVSEFSEPFAAGRKGSSLVPHKKNTDRSENVTGLARCVRAAAGIELENIVTWWERDISHSGPERIILEDAFHITHFMLKRMKGIVEDLVIYEGQVEKNLELTQGVIYSSEVKGLLMLHGVEPEAAYRITQALSQQAWGERRSFLELLLASSEIPAELKNGEVQACFNLEQKLQHIQTIFKRFNL